MGSLKDRIALPMIERAEESGKLTKDKVILEATSGNTGISIAWAATLKGYKCVIVMPKFVSVERRKILRALGAKLVFVSTEAEVVEKAREMARDPKYFMTDQFANEENWKAHYRTTGQEIWEQTDGKITHACMRSRDQDKAKTEAAALSPWKRRLHASSARINYPQQVQGRGRTFPKQRSKSRR